MSIRENLRVVKERIAQAAKSAGRQPEEIRLIAAVKTLPTELVLEALEAGLTDIGDNKVQEARAKQAEVRARFPHVTWHMIGHLQRNKVRQALDIFDIIQTVDSERLAEEIQAKAEAKEVPILVEVNTSGEETKYGIPADLTIDFLKKIANFDKIQVQGLMTVAPLVADPEKTRPCFKKLKRLSENIKKLNLPNVAMRHLSMGMTDDFEVAIQEGANLVRIGRAIFGLPAGRQARGDDKNG